MGVRERTLAAMAQYKLGHNNRVATFPPFSKKGPPPPFTNGPTKRNIPTEHSFDPGALKPMSKALWAASVALGHCLTSYRHLSRLKSTSVSPDGMLGGRGYVMGIKDVRQRLFEACEALSAISDTLHDEIMAPHWKAKLAQLDENDAEDVSRFVGEAQDIMENPEDEAEEEIQKIEEENDGKSKGKDEDAEVESSGMPDGGASEMSEAVPPAPVTKEASTASVSLSAAKVAALFQHANSTIPVDSLPGPRVDHIGPAEGDGPWGSFNEDEFKPEDDAWSADEGGAGRREDGGEDYDYPTPWENDLSRSASELSGDEIGVLKDIQKQGRTPLVRKLMDTRAVRVAEALVKRGLATKATTDDRQQSRGFLLTSKGEDALDDLLTKTAAWTAVVAVKEHSSPEALKQYFKDNPGADKSKHTVKKPKGEGGEKKSPWGPGGKKDPGKSQAEEVAEQKKQKAEEKGERIEKEKAERAKKPKPQQGFRPRPGPKKPEPKKEKPKGFLQKLFKRGEYDFRSESGMPDSTTEDTPTEAWDFGLGYGAKGQGAGGYENPSGEGAGDYGVWGPQSGLPGSPAQSVGDTTPAIDTALNDRRGEGMLPQDVAGPPARRDEYQGPKDNLVQAEALAWGQSGLPGEAPVTVEQDFGTTDTGYVSEDTATPYVRYDHTTKNERPEHQHGRPEEVPWAHDIDLQR